MTQQRFLSFFACAVFSFLCAANCYAHHSFAVNYDSKKTGTIEGVVKKFRFTNPHGILEVEVKTDRGDTQLWTVETTAPGYLQRRGWTRDSIKAGDRVTVDGWLARDGSHLMRLRKIRLPDGKELGQSAPSAQTGE